MSDRPDPFDDLEFETAEPVDADMAVPQATVPTTPAKPQVVVPAAEPPVAEAKPSEAETAAPAPAAPSKLVAYATLGLSALACAGTISAVIVTVVAAQPKPIPPSPERAAIGRIEAMLTGQQKRLETMAADVGAPAAPTVGGADLAALTAVVRANQEAIERLPSMLKAQIPRQGAAVRPVVITKPGAPASDPRVAEVLRSQAAIQRQIEALTAKMGKTAAACVAQNDGQIRYP